MAASQSDIAAGRFVVWNLSRYTGGLDSSGRVQAGGVASNPPIYSNASFASLNYWVFASSYARVAGERTGSARSSALPALSGSPGYGVASYAYDPAANTVTLIMSGAVSATSFHTFKIKSGTQDRLSLLASNAVLRHRRSGLFGAISRLIRSRRRGLIHLNFLRAGLACLFIGLRR